MDCPEKCNSESSSLTVDIAERERGAGLAAPEISGGTSGPETQLFPVSPPGKTDWDVIR